MISLFCTKHFRMTEEAARTLDQYNSALHPIVDDYWSLGFNGCEISSVIEAELITFIRIVIFGNNIDENGYLCVDPVLLEIDEVTPLNYEKQVSLYDSSHTLTDAGEALVLRYRSDCFPVIEQFLKDGAPPNDIIALLTGAVADHLRVRHLNNYSSRRVHEI
ncbi:conserved hypothetical protein [Vibrio chagasii]|nr:conserved hypothetical protein [Vibrio chagasii]